MIAAVIYVQACCDILSEMRRSGMTRQEVTRSAVESKCSVEGCDPDCVEVRIAWDYDVDGDVDLADFGAFQRGDPQPWGDIATPKYAAFAENVGAFW